jgi:hypothetical protein
LLQGRHFLLPSCGGDPGVLAGEVEILGIGILLGRPDLVPVSMGDLALNDIRLEAGLVQDRALHCPEAVDGGALVVPESGGRKEGYF